jgi:lipid-A-disaccharide synthase
MADQARRRKIMMVAGEASGDQLGADLAAQIHARAPDTEILGMGGERMRAAGVRALVQTEDVAAMGATELAGTVRPIVRAFRTLRAAIRAAPPDLLIPIDFPDFNLKLAWCARRAGARVLYYVAPQVWAWRRWRIRTLVKRSDRLAVVFPFEAEMYEKAGGKVTFVGHPLLDRVKPDQDCAATLKRHGFKPRARLLAILPGSRRGEIRYLLRPLLEAARTLAADHDLEPVIVLANTLTQADLEAVAGAEGLTGVRIIGDDAYSIIAASQLALVASGTATLETALLGCPMVIAYRMSAVSYAIGRMMIGGIDFVGMPNLIAGKALVPELIQYDVTPQKLVRAAEPLLAPSLHEELARELREVRERLGAPGAAGRVAALALDLIG